MAMGPGWPWPLGMVLGEPSGSRIQIPYSHLLGPSFQLRTCYSGSL